jgi:hypothetical protein
MTVQQGDILKAKQEQLRGIFSTYHGNVATARRYYDLDFKSEIVPERWRNSLQPLIPPTARHAVDEAVDHILFTPRVRVAARPTTPEKEQEEQEIAEKKRQIIGAWWAQNAKHSGVISDARKTLINEGKVAIRKVIDWNLIPTKPPAGNSKRAKAARDKYRAAVARLGTDDFLWELQVLDNVTVYEDPSNHRNPMYVFVQYEIYTEEAKRIFPRAGDPGYDEVKTTSEADPKQTWRGGDDYEKVKYMEYWSRDRYDADGKVIEEGKYVQWINEERVHDEMNPYPYIPIAIEDAGFGTVRAMAKPEEKFVGMSEHMQPIFRAEAIQMTSWEAVTEMTAFGLYIARNRDPGHNYNVGPGEIIDLEGDDGAPGAETLEAVKLPEIPLGVIQLVQKTTQIANSSLKMETLGGQPLAGVETATEADQQIRNATAKLSGPVAALERLIEKISTWFLIDIEQVIEAPVTLYAIPADSSMPAKVTLNPTDIAGYYEVQAELRTTDEEASNMVKARFWAEMYRLVPFLSAFTAMERGEISDEPQKELLRRTSEDIYLSPEMAMVRKLTAAESFNEFAGLLQTMVENAQNNQQRKNAAQPGGGAGAGGGGGSQSQPTAGLGDSVPAAPAGGAGEARDILQGASQIRG